MVVVGSGFLGVELAGTLRKAGCEVTIVSQETLPMERVIGRRVAAGFAKHLQKQKIEFVGNQELKLFRGDDRRCSGVELQNGEVLPADFVVVACGVVPSMTLDVEPAGQNAVSLAKDG